MLLASLTHTGVSSPTPLLTHPLVRTTPLSAQQSVFFLQVLEPCPTLLFIHNPPTLWR